MNIRKNFLHEVPLPEWQNSDTTPKSSLAAYSIKEITGNTITIKVKFTSSLASATIKAENGGILGPVPEKTVHFDGTFNTFELTHHIDRITREDITWKWKYKRPTDMHWHLITTTHHRIYTVLAEPCTPWTQERSSAVNPWTDALEVACTIAAGSYTPSDAAHAIMSYIHSESGLEYDTVRGKSSYSTSYAKLNLTAWLNNFSKGVVVNCYDCASALAALGNVVGCRLDYHFHWPFGYVNPVIPVGKQKCNNPFYENPQYSPDPIRGTDDTTRSLFANHAYTKMHDTVYDASLRSEKTSEIIPKGKSEEINPIKIKEPVWFSGVSQKEYEKTVIDISTREERQYNRGTSTPVEMSVY
jgi:hypothetical protein